MFITVGVVNMALGKKFILASNSASRYSLLKSAGLSFSKAPPFCNEEKIKKKLLQKKINKKNLPKHLAKEKALSVSKKTPNRMVVGSDTIIIFQKKNNKQSKNLKRGQEKTKTAIRKKTPNYIRRISVLWK